MSNLKIFTIDLTFPLKPVIIDYTQKKADPMIDPAEEMFQCKDCERDMEVDHNLCIDHNDKICYDCCTNGEHSSEKGI